MSTRVTSIVLRRSHFHGFTTNVATKIAVQPDANKDLILIQLNNVDPNLPTDGSLNLTNIKAVEQANLSIMASFATNVARYLCDHDVSLIRLTHWEFPAKAPETQTKAQLKAQAFQDDLIDLEKANIVTRLGIVEFGVESTTGVNWQDIRFIGLESDDLVVRPSPNWQNEQPETRGKLEKWIIPANSRNPRTQGRKRSSAPAAASGCNQVNRFLSPSNALLELRKLRIRETKTFPKATLRMTCPMEWKGLLIGSKCCHMNEIVKEYGVDIPRPNRDDSLIVIHGDSQSCVEAAYAMLDNPSITQDMLQLIKIEDPIESAVSYDIMTIFQAMKGRAKEAVIIGCKSVLSYTVLYKDLFGPGSPDVLVDVELLGLQTLYTRGDITHWLNRHLFEQTIQSAHDYAGFLFGKMVKVSIEAVGFASGNSCFNFRGLIYHDPADSTVTVNEEVLRQGFCKILPSSVYWSYEIKDSMRATYRSLFPNHRPLGTAFDAPLVTGFYQLGRIEMKLLLAEREAAQARRGVWVQAELPEQFLPPRLLQEESRYSKRLVYIDNSNFWISGKHYSGDYKGLGQDKLFQRSAKLARMSVADQEKFIDGIAAYRNMVYGRRPYYASDQSWRVNYQRLLELVGWDRNIDPEWVIAGSVPPENANVWDSFADLGADRVLTHRNAENKASTEDSTLAQRLGKCKEKKFSQIHHLTDYDDIILFGGDRFYKPIVKDILENCDHNRIFIITWGTSACYHGLKLNFSDRVSFINLEPYIDGLFYDVQLVRELSGDATSLSRANDEHRLIRFERKRFPVSVEDMHAVISTESEGQLLQNIHYSLRKNGNYVFVIFRSQGNIAGDWLSRIQDALTRHVQTIAPAAQSTYSGRFSNLELDDDDDEDLDVDDALASYEVDDDIIGEDFDGHY